MATAASAKKDPQQDQQEKQTSNLTLLPLKELGCLRNCWHLQPEDPVPYSDKEQQHFAQWQDPFRMSVLDFQHRTLDKIAEILQIYLEIKQKQPKHEDCGDVTALLDKLEHNTTSCAVELGYVMDKRGKPDHDALKKVIRKLSDTRKSYAHQKYNKSRVREYPQKFSTICTFGCTMDIIQTCIGLATKITKVKCEQEEKRELRIRMLDLNNLKKAFEEFTIYRALEMNSINTFSEYFNNELAMKEAAENVLAKLHSRIKNDENSSDMCKLLVCVLAPRCGVQIQRPEHTMNKVEEQVKESIVVLARVYNMFLVLVMISITIVFLLQWLF